MIKTAVIPLAGLGTRMLPLTKALPKELWPLGAKSTLELILEECFDAGISEVILIISKKKEIIRNYFKRDLSLEKRFKQNPIISKKLKKLHKFSEKIKFVYQKEPKGLGHAVLCAKKYIKTKYFLLILPDDIISKKNCSKELMIVNKKQKGSAIALLKVPKNDVKRYGIVDFLNKKKLQISRMIEKPNVKNSPSRYAIIGRYVLSSKIFKFLSKQKKGKLGEVQITDALNEMLKCEKIYGCKFRGKYLDCGTINGYTKSFIEFNRI